MPLVGASGSQAPIQIYFVNWGMKALQFSRERKYAKLTIYDGGWAEDAASTSGPKTYSAVAASSGASAVAAAPAALPPVVETGMGEWVIMASGGESWRPGGEDCNRRIGFRPRKETGTPRQHFDVLDGRPKRVCKRRKVAR